MRSVRVVLLLLYCLQAHACQTTTTFCPVSYTRTNTSHAHNQHEMKFYRGWKNPSMKLSVPPKLMGKSMGRINTLGVQPLGYTRDGAVKVFHLIAQPVEKIITDSSQKPSWYHLIPERYRADNLVMPRTIIQKLKCWGFNGSMPGPTIEAHEGDRVRIVVKNELPEPTSIHWHGLEVPNEQDGAGGQTQPPIMPGSTYTYEFTLHQSGTFLYHSGFNMMKQDQFGLAGFFIVHPKNYEYTIDKDVAIMLQEWSLLPGNEHPDLVTMSFNWATFNGLATPSIPHISVKQGERVRLRFANMGMNSHPIHLHGYTWQEVGTEGGPIPKSAQRPGNTINVPPGTTRDVEFVAWNPGIWRLHCHKLHHTVNAHADVPMGVMPTGGMFTILYVEPKTHGKHS